MKSDKTNFKQKFKKFASKKMATGGGVGSMNRYDALVHFVTNNGEKMEKEYLGINASSKEDAESLARTKFNNEDADRYEASDIEYISIWDRGMAYKDGGKVPQKFQNLRYGVKVIETIGDKKNEVIVAMFQEKWERDAFLRNREEKKLRRISDSSKEISNYNYEIIPIDNLQQYADGGSMYAEGGPIDETFVDRVLDWIHYEANAEEVFNVIEDCKQADIQIPEDFEIESYLRDRQETFSIAVAEITNDFTAELASYPGLNYDEEKTQAILWGITMAVNN
jgi:hypothetical protein